MTEELDAVLFDAGGVLWDLSPSVEELFAEALSEHAVECEPGVLGDALREADRELDGEFAKLGDDEREFWRRYDDAVLRRIGAEVDVGLFAEHLSSRLREVVHEVGSWVAFPDAVPALENVRRMGLKTGMVSNATELARRVLRNLHMERHFDVVVISDEVGVRKPDPRIFHIALEEIGAARSRTMFLGDRPATDIAGAAAAGVRGVLVDRRDTFPDAACQRIRSLNELARLI